MITIPNSYINITSNVEKGSFHILGLGGKRRSGKDYTADILRSIDPRFTRISFADFLKDTYAKMEGIPVEELTDVHTKEKHRRNLQNFSLKMKQEHGEFVFVNKLLDLVEPGKYYVIPDVRFLCELQTIVLLGGTVYKIHAENHHRAQRGWVQDDIIDSDVSETEVGNLSADILYHCSGGGMIFNTQGEEYIIPQLQKIISNHFPIVSIELLRKLKSLE